jgi:hypothetical protein
MKCEKIVNKFLELDNGEPTPLSVRFHVFWCAKCRNEIFDLRRKFQSVKGSAAFKAPSGLCDLVMNRIELLEIEYEQNVSNMKWLGSGIVIFAGIFSISFSSWADWMISRTGSDFEPFLYGIMGLCLTIYSVSYIATHLSTLRRLFTKVDEGIRLRMGRA